MLRFWLVDFKVPQYCKHVFQCPRIFLFWWGHSAFFFRLLIASNAFPDIGSPWSVGLKKKNLKKKKHKKSRNRRPWYPRMTLKVNIYIFGLTKCTIYCKKMFLFLFLFFSMLLLCSFFRLKELFQVKSGLTASLLFFFLFENAKNLGRSDDAKRSKKRGWPEPQSINRGENHHMYNFPMRDSGTKQ